MIIGRPGHGWIGRHAFELGLGGAILVGAAVAFLVQPPAGPWLVAETPLRLSIAAAITAAFGLTTPDARGIVVSAVGLTLSLAALLIVFSMVAKEPGAWVFLTPTVLFNGIGLGLAAWGLRFGDVSATALGVRLVLTGALFFALYIIIELAWQAVRERIPLGAASLVAPGGLVLGVVLVVIALVRGRPRGPRPHS